MYEIVGLGKPPPQVTIVAQQLSIFSNFSTNRPRSPLYVQFKPQTCAIHPSIIQCSKGNQMTMTRSARSDPSTARVILTYIWAVVASWRNPSSPARGAHICRRGIPAPERKTEKTCLFRRGVLSSAVFSPRRAPAKVRHTSRSHLAPLRIFGGPPKFCYLLISRGLVVFGCRHFSFVWVLCWIMCRCCWVPGLGFFGWISCELPSAFFSLLCVPIDAGLFFFFLRSL
jgi:hypothetical protein